MALSDYKTWYDEAMCASNEAGFAGVSAAQTIRDLDSDNARLTRERDQALAALRTLPESLADLSGCENTAGVYACVQYVEQVLLEFPQ